MEWKTGRTTETPPRAIIDDRRGYTVQPVPAPFSSILLTNNKVGEGGSSRNLTTVGSTFPERSLISSKLFSDSRRSQGVSRLWFAISLSAIIELFSRKKKKTNLYSEFKTRECEDLFDILYNPLILYLCLNKGYSLLHSTPSKDWIIEKTHL